ncbi:MAG: acetyl-CoA carboxylase biotin carboxyl carrier protein subunit [Bacteroidales bacterium]|nr:acetyl-CoA carboxylase biotin carboxyl carrier protein subunit [Bacteroidales bacterium]
MKEYQLKINGNDYNVVIKEVEDNTADVEVNGTPYRVEYEKPITKQAKKVIKSVTPVARPAAAAPTAAPAAQPAAAPAAGGAGATVTSPLPGIILDIAVKEGDVVKKGQKIVVLEAMKMENVIESTADGTVTSIKVNKGDSVLEGAPLVIIG